MKLQKIKTQSKLIIVLGLMLLSLSHTAAWGGIATLVWIPPTTKVDGSPLMDLAGFKIYYGTMSNMYSQVLDVGMTGTPGAPQYTLTNLAEGYTYYFAVTAYDGSGNESGLSDEASKSFGTSGSGSSGDGASSIGGGCGRIKNISGGSGPDAGRFALNLLIPVFLLLIQKLFYQARKRYAV